MRPTASATPATLCAHYCVALSQATVGLGGFGVRFTVQYNLFAGSIVGLGGPEQVENLNSIQATLTLTLP